MSVFFGNFPNRGKGLGVMIALFDPDSKHSLSEIQQFLLKYHKFISHSQTDPYFQT